MDVLDEIQARLLKQGRSLGLVYLCSHLPAASYVSTEYMTKTYPRSFQYSTLPRIDTGKEETEITAFKAVSNGYVGLPPLKDLYVEYLADIHAMIEADIYIGAFSNVYGVAGSMVRWDLLTSFPFLCCLILSIVSFYSEWQNIRSGH